MTTQYTPILKLALPVQGELSGTWGDVVNDNITSMIEQAIAGRLVINTWSGNSHTLTTANGTTAEARAAMLSLTDSNTQLNAAGTVVCPALSKTYIVKNGAGQIITVKTASGSGIAIPNGKTMLVYCDGTNVLEGVDHVVTLSAGTLTITGLTTFASLKGADATTVTGILDEDNMASNSATKLVTQQSVKAYVDSQVGTVDTLAEILANGNTTGGTDIVASTDDKVQFRDAAIYINSGADGHLDVVADTEVQIVTSTLNVDAAVDLSSTLVLAGNADFNGDLDVDGVTNLDVVDIDGAVDMASTLQVDGAATFTAEITANGGIALGDGDVATFGAGDDLQIYHDGSNSHIKDTATGNLNISGNDIQILNAASNEAMAYFAQDGSVTLYHNGSEKLATTSTGIDITGNMIADGVGIGTDSLFFTASGRGSLSLNGSASSILAFGKNGSSENYMLADSGGFTIANTSATLPTKFFNNGSDRMTIDSSGNVGIGTSPSTKLHVQDSAGSPQIRIDNQGTASGIASLLFRSGGAGNPSSIIQSGGTSSGNQGIVFKHGDFGAEAERMRIDASGNVGIGESIPTEKLHVGGNIKMQASTAIVTYQNAVNTWNVGLDAADASFKFKDGTDERLRIDNQGRVGIGNAVASSMNAGANQLVVGSGSTGQGITLYSSTSTAGSIHFADGTSGDAAYRGQLVYNHNGDYMAILTAATEAARIDSSQNLLVGTTSLQLYASSSATGGVITSGGAFIGAANGPAGLFNRVNSEGDAAQFFQAGNYVGSISVSSSALFFNSSSDERLKENIVDSPVSSDDIDAIQVRSFDWKASGEHQKYGMIAQELQAVAPEAVSGDADSEDMMGVDYSKLVPMLIKEIQSLRQRVAQLEE